MRHPAANIAPGICYGRLDVGIAQPAGQAVAAIVASLGGFAATHLWSSPARRCREVADVIAASLHLAAIQDERLLELDFGTWEGRPWEDVPREALESWASAPMAFAAPGGESGLALIARVTEFAFMVAGMPGDAVIVSHGGPLKLLAALLRGRPADLLAPPPALGSVAILTMTLSAQDRPPSP